jgi:hypothetical protein
MRCIKKAFVVFVVLIILFQTFSMVFFTGNVCAIDVVPYYTDYPFGAGYSINLFKASKSGDSIIVTNANYVCVYDFRANGVYGFYVPSSETITSVATLGSPLGGEPVSVVGTNSGNVYVYQGSTLKYQRDIGQKVNDVDIAMWMDDQFHDYDYIIVGTNSGLLGGSEINVVLLESSSFQERAFDYRKFSNTGEALDVCLSGFRSYNTSVAYGVTGYTTSFDEGIFVWKMWYNENEKKYDLIGNNEYVIRHTSSDDETPKQVYITDLWHSSTSDDGMVMLAA